MAVWFEAIETIVGVAALGLALLLAWRGRRAATTYILAAWLVSLSIYYLARGFGEHVGMSPETVVFAMGLASTPRPFLVAAFAFVFLRPVLPVKLRVALAALAMAALAYAGVTVFAPMVFFQDGGVTSFGRNLFFSLSFGSFVLAVGALGWRWSRARRGQYRTQSLWGLLPFLFWTIHDSIGFVVLPLMLGAASSTVSPLHSRAIPDWPVIILAALGLAIVAALGVVAVQRMMAGRMNGDARVLFFVALYTIPVSLVQLFEPGLHGPVDALIVPLLAYGVMRHQVIDIDLRLRWTLRRGAVPAVLGVAFFVVSEAAVEVLTVDVGLGRWLGLMAAGLMLLAFAPLQRLADRLADTALPRTRDAAAHLGQRAHDIYRAAAEELLADGHLTPKEWGALARLRTHLQLEAEAASAIELAVARSAVPTPVPPTA